MSRMREDFKNILMGASNTYYNPLSHGRLSFPLVTFALVPVNIRSLNTMLANKKLLKLDYFKYNWQRDFTYNIETYDK